MFDKSGNDKVMNLPNQTTVMYVKFHQKTKPRYAVVYTHANSLNNEKDETKHLAARENPEINALNTECKRRPSQGAIYLQTLRKIRKSYM